MEILSPVGGEQQLYAAVRSGADAVYLGTKRFSARAMADNFDGDSLKSAVEYCHARNVKVYVTLNTIITDNELKSAADEITNVSRCGADAVIVQDMAMFRLVRQIAPQMSVHASTQMSIHNLSGALELQRLGFKRVVPARELSLDELKYIRDNTSVELEVFIHGALCMCISGQCYLSSVLGQRSANRGRCAQPCRLDFKSDNGRYALSLKDLSAIDLINKLLSMGIDSVKIEGRMKRPEYVAAATSACKNALCGNEFDRNALQAVFSRSGFTDGYLTDRRGRDMFGYRTKDDVVSAAPVLKSIANEYRKEAPLVAVDMSVSISDGESITLSVTDGKNTAVVTGAKPEKAVNRPVDSSLVERSLSKCGGTPFFVRNTKCEIDDGLSVPISELNTLRKAALDKLELARSHSVQYRINSYESLRIDTIETSGQKIFARFESVGQICDGADRIIIDYEILYTNPELCKKYGESLIAELPALMFSEKTAELKLGVLKERGVKCVYAPNMYAISLGRRLGFEICGGYGLNIINSVALNEYRQLGVTMSEISFECTLEWFDRLKKSVPCGIIAYGKMPLMTFRNCPIKTPSGCADCDGRKALTDRLGNKMTVMCRSKQYGQLLNPRPIYMGDKLEQLKKADFLTFYFTDETKSECERIFKMIRNGQSADFEFTRGLYYKEIL